MNKVNWLLKLAIVCSLIMVSACAHKIQVTPSLDKLRSESTTKKNKIVGYHIAPQDKLAEVETGGGGGDSITYSPYKDSEAALNTILSKNFYKVYSVDNLSNKGYINEKKIELIFLPKITTTSSSKSLVTWPPTNFTVELMCKAVDLNGQEIWSKTVQSEGKATFSEFKSDFGLAGRRAMEKAFSKMFLEISTAKEL